jgi:hypothetical protein
MYDFTTHIGTKWFDLALEQHNKGMDHLYTYGIRCIKDIHKRYHEAGYHKIPAFHPSYTPNPFRTQYDFTVYVWINYQKILKLEVDYLESLAKKERSDKYSCEAEELRTTKKLYGISREDFLFAAADMRWPTTILPDGRHEGQFVRDPWSNLRVQALSHPELKNVISFGGGGQGKTHVSLGFALMIFDYYLWTQRGARCMISTVNEDKLDSVGWSYLCRLNSSTSKEISLSAGNAKIAGNHTLARPGIKDKAGVFKGLLIGNQMNKQSIVDKLTGSHGHPFLIYVLDEMQSTPDIPITASNNFTMHAKDYRIIGSGNFGENNDTLSTNIEPLGGWKTVDENTGQWISKMQNGQKAIVLHFNNNNSPGITKDGNRKWPYLPSLKILDEKYPKETRNEANIGYRRFWTGWRIEGSGTNCVIYEKMVLESGSNKPLTNNNVNRKWLSFDSAQADNDRNLATVFQEELDQQTKGRVFGPLELNELDKATEGIKYYKESTNQLWKIIKKNNINSGDAIVDWTGRPAHAEMLAAKGFHTVKLIYNKGVPDGKRIDPITKRRERAIPLGIELDFKKDMAADKICAHHVSENLISFAAWLTRQYVITGRLRNINDNLLNGLNCNSISKELFSRVWEMKNSNTHGQRFILQSKKEFKKSFGFSPDILDTIFQGCYFAFVHRQIPLTKLSSGDKLPESTDADADAHLDIWEQDLIEA